MASLGHIAVGMAAARVYRSGGEGLRPSALSMAAWSALSMLPDADVVGFAIGVKYEDPWGHRGATHSIAFGCALAALIAVATPRPRWRTGAIAAAVLVSHGVLDTLTDGGLGAALFWPFDLTRYFAPWRPIPVAPIGLAFFSPYGLFVSIIEVILFAPVVWVAWRRPTAGSPRRRAGIAALLLWAGAVWLIGSTDPVRQSLLASVFRDRTEFAPAFSEASFTMVRSGMTEEEVRRRVGAPIDESWYFFDDNANSAAAAFDRPSTPRCPFLTIASDVVTTPFPERDAAICAERGIRPGVSRAAVEQALGTPNGKCWRYSRNAGGNFFRMRMVCFWKGNVEEVMSRWMPDRHQE